MLKAIITKLKENKTCAALASTAITVISAGLQSNISEIRTISFFVLLELLVIAIAFVTLRIVHKFESIRLFLYSSVNNFILGLHLVAGMVVVGVYFTV